MRRVAGLDLQAAARDPICSGAPFPAENKELGVGWGKEVVERKGGLLFSLAFDSRSAHCLNDQHHFHTIITLANPLLILLLSCKPSWL